MTRTLACTNACLIALLLSAHITAAQPTTQPSTRQRDDGGKGTANNQPQDEDYTLFEPAPLTGTIGTGRPSFGTGTTAVPVGRLQIETGVLFTRDGDDDSIALPNLLLRYGVHDRVEVRFGTSGIADALGDDRDFGDQLGDIRVGAKFEVFIPGENDPAWLPKVAVQPSLKLPTGSAGASDQIDPAVQVAASWSINNETGLLFNADLFTNSIETDTSTRFSASLLVARDLSEDWAVFGELIQNVDDTFSDTTVFDAGVLYLLRDNLQLDAFVGVGLNDAADDVFVGGGVAFRI